MFLFHARRVLHARTVDRRFSRAHAVLIVLCTLGTGIVQAEDLLEDSQIWSAVLATGTLKPVGEHWRYWMEGAARFGNDMSTLSQGMIRPGVGYALNPNASLWLGYAHIVTDTPFARKTFDENRIWQQFMWNRPVGAGTFSARSRLEQRFADSGDDVPWRFRQFFKMAYPIAALPKISAVAWDEVFVNLDDADWGPQSGFDQNRAFVGAGYGFSKVVRAEVGYFNQFIDRPINPNRMTHALSINLFLTFP